MFKYALGARMVKLLLVLCVVIVVTVTWIIAFKVYKVQKFRQKHSKYQAPDKPASVSESEYIKSDETLVFLVDAYEQQLFDNIAELFMQEGLRYEIEQAKSVQDKVFRKMPVCSKTQIRQLDLEEWSIYWTFYDQSLEYYAGKYGVFFAHVDRFGIEHKHEIRTQGVLN